MYIKPQTKFKLIKGVPFDRSNAHVILFPDVATQTQYFLSKVTKSFDDFTYVKEERKVRVPVSADTIYDCDYCMFMNEGYGSKWFYGFVRDIEHKNNGVSYVDIEVDEFQTWLFDMEIGKCFVEREHVADDTKGLHTVPEGLETGPYICQHEKEKIESLGTAVYFVTDRGVLEGHRENNIYTACLISGHKAGTEGIMNDLLIAFEDTPERVPLLISMPDSCIPSTGGWVKSYTETFKVDPPADINGYVPHNNKLFTYPYCMLMIDNYAGSSNVLRFELAGVDVDNEGGIEPVAEDVTPVDDIVTTAIEDPVETSGNFYLSLSQRQNNAQIIYNGLIARGWSELAIFATLGNMDKESRLNPGIWQSLDEGNLEGGYGLTQWTPASKYIDWCTENNYDKATIETALTRLDLEFSGQFGQWIPTSDYPMSAQDYKVATTADANLYGLTAAFMRNYERPASTSSLSERYELATYWQNFLQGGTVVTPDEPYVPDVTETGYAPIALNYVALPNPKPVISTYPVNYKGSAVAIDEGISFDNFAQCPWVNDSFKQWLNFNGVNLAMQTIGGIGMGAIGSIGAGNHYDKAGNIKWVNQGARLASKAGVALSAVTSVYDAVKQVEYQQLHSKHLNGGIGGSALNAGIGRVGMRYRTMTIKQEFAKIIDEFFDRYGYRVNRYKVPELYSRNGYNFVKCAEAHVNGNIPNSAKERVEELLIAGVTFWHTTDVMNYAIDNSIVE